MSEELQEERSTSAPGLDEDGLRTLVTRLARPHRSGGQVIERAALLASGADFTAAVAWIEAHGGIAELRAAAKPRGGLHSARLAAVPGDQTPLRCVLPAGTLA